ncbi:helix-turn-helix transcriptional regulator [Meridianimarinicoccus sp. RP-17]|uniref:helix-turn-helix transcriptional regulator n=1 Tax=Meridianimarinicoccus zhengii TaxID=2056810 RepID=UPI000DAD0994|nr:helix-turn-helix transcriptional regulator [Phycocomes zhengii]
MARDVVLDSMRDTFDDTWTESSWVAFVFPREGFEHLEFVDRAGGPLKGACAQLFGEFALALVDTLRTASTEERAGLAHTTTAMIRACFQRPVAPGTVSADDIAQMDRARVYRTIQLHLASPRLTLNRICQLSGLSRSALYRLFESHGGVANYILERRLDAVMRDLSDPALASRSIANIAESRGFHSAAAFSRTFSRHFGCSPRDARKALLVGALVQRGVIDRTGTFRDLLG